MTYLPKKVIVMQFPEWQTGGSLHTLPEDQIQNITTPGDTMATMAANPCCLWMGDLEGYMDEMFIGSAFAAMGEHVINVKLIRHKASGTPAGYCFVEFTDQQTAERVLQRLNGLPVPGTNPIKRFKLNYAMYGKENPAFGIEHSLFVGDLTPNVTDYMLLTFFQARYQSVKAAKIVVDNHSRPKGYGFVRFFDETEYSRALFEMQGAVGLGAKPIRVSTATPKNKKGEKGQDQETVQAQMQQYYRQQYEQYLQSWNQQNTTTTGQNPMTMDQYYQAYYQQQYQAQQEEEDQTPEDPNPPLDIEADNWAIMETEQELYLELEESRWQPLETVTATVPTKTVLT